MTDWELALSTASDALQLAQDLQTNDKRMGKAERRAQLAQLAGMLAELKQTLLDTKLQG
jgi:hypothetical protein